MVLGFRVRVRAIGSGYRVVTSIDVYIHTNLSEGRLFRLRFRLGLGLKVVRVIVLRV